MEAMMKSDGAVDLMTSSPAFALNLPIPFRLPYRWDFMTNTIGSPLVLMPFHATHHGFHPLPGLYCSCY